MVHSVGAPNTTRVEGLYNKKSITTFSKIKVNYYLSQLWKIQMITIVVHIAATVLTITQVVLHDREIKHPGPQ